MDGWMDFGTSELLYLPLIWQKQKTAEPMAVYKKEKTTWDGAAQPWALRMINGFANPVGL